MKKLLGTSIQEPETSLLLRVALELSGKIINRKNSRIKSNVYQEEGLYRSPLRVQNPIVPRSLLYIRLFLYNSGSRLASLE